MKSLDTWLDEMELAIKIKQIKSYITFVCH